MSIITDSAHVSQSALAGGQIGPVENTGREAGAQPTQATATTAKGRGRRARPDRSQVARGNDTRVAAAVTDVAPATPTGTTQPKKMSKQDMVLKLLRQAEGATIDELMDATAWQAHSLRGFLSGTVRKKLQLDLISDVVGNGVRRYRVVSADQAGGGSEADGQPTTEGFAGMQGA